MARVGLFIDLIIMEAIAKIRHNIINLVIIIKFIFENLVMVVIPKAKNIKEIVELIIRFKAWQSLKTLILVVN